MVSYISFNFLLLMTRVYFGTTYLVLPFLIHITLIKSISILIGYKIYGNIVCNWLSMYNYVCISMYISTAALACDTTNGHKPTAVVALKLVIAKHMQNEKPDYSQCRYVLHTLYPITTILAWTLSYHKLKNHFSNIATNMHVQNILLVCLYYRANLLR